MKMHMRATKVKEKQAKYARGQRRKEAWIDRMGKDRLFFEAKFWL